MLPVTANAPISHANEILRRLLKAGETYQRIVVLLYDLLCKTFPQLQQFISFIFSSRSIMIPIFNAYRDEHNRGN